MSLLLNIFNPLIFLLDHLLRVHVNLEQGYPKG